MPASSSLTGGSLCGAVRYRITGAPKWVAHCHCDSCRRQTGAAFATYAGIAHDGFAYTQGKAAAHQSSPGVARGFCLACGTPLTFEGDRWPDEVHVHLGTLDDPGELAPQAHVYTEEQVPWLHMADSLPRFARTTDED